MSDFRREETCLPSTTKSRRVNDGRIVITDRQGNHKVASSFFTTAEGLAWSRDGKEIWFTAAREGAARAIYAMDLAGKERLVLRVPGTLTLQDITPDGRVLLTVDNDQIGVLGARSGETSERDLCWFDWSLTADASRDGKNLVFFESGEGVGANYSTFIRGMDGSPAVRLGSGTYPSLSPDGKWVAVVNNASPSQLEILPTGTGQPRQITHDSLEHLSVGWAPNGRAIVFSASEPNHAVRTYWMNLDDGKNKGHHSKEPRELEYRRTGNTCWPLTLRASVGFIPWSGRIRNLSPLL
jgi:Tol biopolymer transport system component